MFDDNSEIKKLEKIAQTMRIDVIKMLWSAGSGHPGGSLSCIEIICALFFSVMRINPVYPLDDKRDRFILSKGHAAPTLYSALSLCGMIERTELPNLRKYKSRLQGHPDYRCLPFVEMSAGPLGHGISFANGVAYGMKCSHYDSRIYVLCGDGELQEGQIWEAALFSAHHNLDNLIVIIDNNGLQLDGPISGIKTLEPIADKFQTFGWDVMTIDGHNFSKLLDATRLAYSSKKPVAIIAHTIKGKGIKELENNPLSHGQHIDNNRYHRYIKELL